MSEVLQEIKRVWPGVHWEYCDLFGEGARGQYGESRIWVRRPVHNPTIWQVRFEFVDEHIPAFWVIQEGPSLTDVRRRLRLKVVSVRESFDAARRKLL